jgi:hypothetical protein
MVDGMKKQLAELEPVLKEKAAATAELLIQASLRAVPRARCAPAQRACREREDQHARARAHTFVCMRAVDACAPCPASSSYKLLVCAVCGRVAQRC